MTITREAVWREAIRKVATTDAVLGGDDDAPLNKSAADLADCTEFLHERLIPVEYVVEAVDDSGWFYLPGEFPLAGDSDFAMRVLEIEVLAITGPDKGFTRFLAHVTGPTPQHTSSAQRVGSSSAVGDFIDVTVTIWGPSNTTYRIGVMWTDAGTPNLLVRARELQRFEWSG